MHVIFIFFYEFFFPWVFFDIRIEKELGDPRTILFSTSLIGVYFRGRTTDILSLVQMQAKVLPTPPTLTKSIFTQHFSTFSARSSESKHLIIGLESEMWSSTRDTRQNRLPTFFIWKPIFFTGQALAEHFDFRFLSF